MTLAEPDFLSLLWDEQLQQLMLVACPDGVMLTDPEDRILLYTGASESLFGWAPVEALGKQTGMLFEDSQAYQYFRAQLRSEGRVTNIELNGRRRDGSSFLSALSASLLRDRYGDALGTVLYIRDHTHLHQIQHDLQHKNEELNEMVEVLDHVARHDHLTGLLHRGSAMTAAESALLEAGLKGRPFGVAVFDMDHFKNVNDSYGHLVGDEVLAALATTLKDSARAEDILGRFGGEEFVAFLPGARLESVAGYAERVRTAVEERTVIARGEVAVKVTISAGVASIPTCADNLLEAIRIADERLLAAKRSGRNRVQSTDPQSTWRAA
jgi:diguanylate cyclase (GGDEF)-like protein/PAS domain S-box-containing protein